MVRYHRDKIHEFLVKYDWNRLLQGIMTFFISVGVGLYCYEQKSFSGVFKLLEGRNIPGADYLADTSRPFLVVGMVVIGVCLVAKIMIYFSLFDVNDLKGKQTVKSGKQSRPTIDINGILHEISTAILGITIGMFTTPVVKNAVIFQKAEYPDPTVGIILTLCCFIFKVLLYSEALDFNHVQTCRIWKANKVKPFLGSYDWNEFFQEFGTTCIGIGIGFYMYESRVIFLPQEWFPGLFGGLQEETTGIFKTVQRWTQGTPLETTLKWMPDLFTNESAKPYIIGGGILIGICAVIKLGIYFTLWDMNQLRDVIVGNKSHRTRRISKANFNGIIDEIVTLILTTLVGILVTPILSGAFDEKVQGDPSYQIGFVVLLLFLVGVKFLLMTEALEFGASSRSSGVLPKKNISRTRR